MKKRGKLTRSRFHKLKIKNRQLTRASFTKLMLKDEDDTFWFHFKWKTSPNRKKAIPQTENKKPSAHRSQLC
jgi:hypothetical protein